MAKRRHVPDTTFRVDLAFEIPPLGDRHTSTAAHEQHVEITYFDTDDRRLVARGVTLGRHRDADPGWRLALPGGDTVELPLNDAADGVGDEIVALTRGLTGGETLRPYVILRIARVTHVVSTAGRRLADVSDDRITVTETGETASVIEWRELHVTAAAADARGRVRDIAARLTAAGATASRGESELARVLAGSSRPALPASDLIAAYLSAQADALTAADVQLRRGSASIHKTRVAVRRMRSALRIFAPMLPADAAGLEQELAWYQALLGEIRDREVQRARMRDAVRDEDNALVLGAVAADIEETLLGDELRARETLARELDSPRYQQLHQRIASLLAGPAARYDTDRVVRLARKAQKKARRRLVAATRDSSAGRLHRARKATKRARYATEVIEPAVGKSARRRIKRYKHAQDVLGEHQDAVVAMDFLRRRAVDTVGHADRNGFTYGILFQRERARAAELAERARRL